MLSFAESIGECEADLKMHVEIASDTSPGDEPATPIKAVVYWLNSHTGYFMAPRELFPRNKVNITL